MESQKSKVIYVKDTILLNRRQKCRVFSQVISSGYRLQAVRGFTMAEVSLSLSILVMIFAMSMPLYRTFNIRNDMDIAVTTLVQDFRRAQTLSQITDGDSSWGVHVATGSILIYKGQSFVLRDQSFDETTEISTSIIISGLNDVYFSKQAGLPQSTGTTTFTSLNNEIRNVTINQKGMVDY
jgi:hypothetical protein